MANLEAPVWVVLPTYCEAGNIRVVLERLSGLGLNMLVVDDDSPDGTAEVVEEFRKSADGVHLLRRGSKTSLGAAYLEGFEFALSHGAGVVVTMDADLSHDPSAVPSLLSKLGENGCVVGSRYVAGGEIVNWPLRRLALSSAANWFVRMLFGMPVKDCTSGFRAYRSQIVEQILAARIHSHGYSFQVEALKIAVDSGMGVVETPITFVERVEGTSKMGFGEVVSGVRSLFALRIAGSTRLSAVVRSDDETRPADIVSRLAATAVVLVFLLTVYSIFDRYDWGYPLVKLACFAVLFAAIVSLRFIKTAGRPMRSALLAEAAVLGVFLLAILAVRVPENIKYLHAVPANDIGSTTIHAARVLFVEGENPYSRTDINSHQTDLAADYHGFHYGPLELIGYMPSAFFGATAYKSMSVVYVLITLLLLGALVFARENSALENAANVLFVSVAYLMAGRFWTETFREGVNDPFHIMLLLAGLFFLKHGRIFLTGLLVGLSISAKFAPGIFLIPFLPLRKRELWFGIALGLLAYLPFFVSDASGVWRNAFWLRVVIPYNSTSLYSITPESFHWIFGAVLVVSGIAALLWARGRDLPFEAVAVGFTLLALVADATQRQVHLNHLIWFLPFLAIIFLGCRDRLSGYFAISREAEA